MITLNNRTVIYITGSEKKSFLQGLITNDVNKVSENNAIYAAMLTPSGRFLYDFFIIQFEDKLLLDCSKSRCEEIIKKLSLYKLRANIQIGKMDKEFAVYATINEEVNQIKNEIKSKSLVQKFICFDDPRSKEMGLRLIISKLQLSQLTQKTELQKDKDNIDIYNHHRLNLKIIDDSDLVYDKSLILEYGFDNLNAVDYQKGCYIGQEVVSRTHYRGLVRKAVYLVEIENLVEIAKGTQITCDNKKIGIILSSILHKKNPKEKFGGKLKALVLIKNINSQNQNIDLKNIDLRIGQNKVNLVR